VGWDWIHSHSLVYCTSRGWWMMSVKRSVEWLSREIDVLWENLPNVTLSASNPTWPDLRSQRLISCGIARTKFQLAKTLNHITFLVKCKSQGIIPKGIVLKDSPVQLKLKLKLKLICDRQSVGQFVWVSSLPMGPLTRFYLVLLFSADSYLIILPKASSLTRRQ
jgi:hypothetical protein